METNVSLLNIELDTLRRNLNDLSRQLGSVSNSKRAYSKICDKMILLIKEMLVSSKGWMTDEDLDAQAIAILEEYKNLINGIQRRR